MKSLEILLRLIDNLLAAIRLRKAQHERIELEQTPDTWFRTHFGYGVQSKDGEADKTNTGNNA